MPKNIYATPAGEDWIVRRESNGPELDCFDTQQEAKAAGRAHAREEKVQFELHGADGQIRQRDSYGNDPSDMPG